MSAQFVSFWRSDIIKSGGGVNRLPIQDKSEHQVEEGILRNRTFRLDIKGKTETGKRVPLVAPSSSI